MDNLKGVLIILVILGHGGLLTSLKSPVGDFLQGFIYLFHMPLFFALSALFIKEFSFAYIFKRFVQLMVPFYFFVIIDPIHIILQLTRPGMSAMPLLFDFSWIAFIKKGFIGSAFYLQSVLWFLPTLFLANITFSIIWFGKDRKLMIAAFILTFCGVIFFAKIIHGDHYRVPYGMDAVVYILPIMVLIRFIYGHRTYLAAYHPLIYVVGGLCSFLLIMVFIPRMPVDSLTGRFDLAQFCVPDTLWGYALIAGLSACIFLLFLRFRKRSVFSKIGIYTMPIFLFHVYPWFGAFQFLSPFGYLLVNVAGNILVGIGLSKLLMKVSSRFSWVGMVS